MAVGNRVAKKEENLLDFFKHSKRGRKEGGKEKEEQGGDWMDLEEETKGEVVTPGLCRNGSAKRLKSGIIFYSRIILDLLFGVFVIISFLIFFPSFHRSGGSLITFRSRVR